MDSYQITKFLISPNTESERVLFACSALACGFYRNKGFFCTPHIYKEFSSRADVVIIPNLAYEKIPNFWQKMFDMRHNDNYVPNLAVMEKVRQQFENSVGVKTERMKQLEDEWERLELIFWKIIKQVFPEVKTRLRSIEVRFTQFGTIASYGYLSRKKGLAGWYYLREDAGLGNLVEVIITSLLYADKKDGVYSWHEIEAITDFILTRSRLATFFPNYHPTLLPLRATKKESWHKDSRQYLESLKVIYFDQIVKYSKGSLFIHDDYYPIKLTARENKLVRLLVHNQQRVVSFNDVADQLEKQPGEVSLSSWAINKAVQRLREKIVRAHIPLRLETRRKFGYILSPQVVDPINLTEKAPIGTSTA